MRRTPIAACALATLATIATPALGASGQVPICHATASATNPFVLIHPAAAGVLKGHLGHQDGRDVIPPFTFRGASYSQNWDASGRALHADGCVARVTPPGGGSGGGGGGSF